jgi:hypothetical protein
MIRTNEECCFDLRYSSLVRHHHAFLPPRQTNKPSKKLNATTPPTTFTPPTQNACIYATHHHHQRPQHPKKKHHHITNCQRTFQRERKKENPSNQHTIPGAKEIGYPPHRLHPPRKKKKKKIKSQGRRRGEETNLGLKGKREKGKGGQGACLFLLIIQLFFRFHILLSCAFGFLLLCFSVFIPEASIRMPFCKGKLEGRAWCGVDTDLDTDRVIAAK